MRRIVYARSMKPLSAVLRPLLAVALAVVLTALGTAGRSRDATGEQQPDATILLAQVDTTSVPSTGDEDEEEVPIPPNLLDKETLPDTSGGAVRDTVPQALPVNPGGGLPDTLHMPTPGGTPRPGQPAASNLPTSKAPRRGSVFGLPPIFVIAAIVAINVIVIKAVAD